MNKINPKVVIEPTNTTIKIVVGYILDKKPVILYANAISTSKIKNGNITDIKFLVYLFKNISHFEIKELKLKLNIKNVILILPSINLKIFKVKKKIENNNDNNIEEINLLIKREINKNNLEIINIEPLFFYTKNGDKIDQLNIKEEINDYLCLLLVYTLPKKIVDNYNYLFESSKIKIQKKILSSQAISYLLPYQTYIYVDIGFSYTNISFISKKKLYESYCFNFGGDDITKLIAEKFHASIEEAEKIKRIYGYTKIIKTFNPIIFSSTFNNQKKSYTVSDLNDIIKNYLNEYFICFNKYLDMIFLNLNHKDKKNIYPVIIGGGGSKLNGLDFFLKEKCDKYNFNFAKLDVIGARNEKYLNCIGALFC